MSKNPFQKRYIILGLIILLLVGYFGYAKILKKEIEDRYILAKVERKTISVSVSGSGNVEAEKEIDLKSEVPGKILEILCKEGDRVKKGDILIKLDSENAREQVNLAQRAVEDAEKSLTNAQKSIFDAESALNDAKISLENLQKKYEKAKRDRDNSLKTTYKNTLDSLSLFYNDAQSMFSEIEGMFKNSSYGAKDERISVGENEISDIDYYYFVVKTLGGEKILYFEEGAKNKFNNLKSEFEQKRQNYWKVSLYSPGFEIESVLNESYQLSQKLLNLLRQTSNLISKYKKVLDEKNLTPPFSLVITDSQNQILLKYDAKISPEVNTFKQLKETIENLKDNQEIRDLETQIIQAQNNVSRKESALSQAQNAYFLAQNALSNAKDKLKNAKEHLKKHFIKAPFDGIVAKINVKEGDIISTQTALLHFITQQKIIKVSLNEIDAVKVKVGQKAILTFDALPDLTLTGKVAEISPVGTISQGVTSFDIKIVLDSDEERIKPGMSANAEIIIEEKPNVLTLPNSAVKSEGNSRYVLLIDTPREIKDKFKIGTPTVLPKEVKIKNQPVEIGISNDTMSEILSGVSEGDIVISSKVSQKTQTTKNQTQFRFQIPGTMIQRR
jgi:RND family efflux transporter MFP subunit